MTKDEKIFICEIMGRLLNCYDEAGNTVPEYYENIILPDLSVREMELLRKLASFDV